MKPAAIAILLLLSLALANNSRAQSVDIGPLSLGNSSNHRGLRINARDSGVQTIKGINFTLWKAKRNLSQRFS